LVFFLLFFTGASSSSGAETILLDLPTDKRGSSSSSSSVSLLEGLIELKSSLSFFAAAFLPPFFFEGAFDAFLAGGTFYVKQLITSSTSSTSEKDLFTMAGLAATAVAF
jgi:hypothetical protein